MARVYDKDGVPEDVIIFWPNNIGSVVGWISACIAWKLGSPAILAGVVDVVIEDFVAHVICVWNGYGPGYGVALWRFPSKGRYFGHLLVFSIAVSLIVATMVAR